MNQLTGVNLVILIFCFKNILRGMNILNNDVMAILNEKVNSISASNGRSPTLAPGPDKQGYLSPLKIPFKVPVFLH